MYPLQLRKATQETSNSGVQGGGNPARRHTLLYLTNVKPPEYILDSKFELKKLKLNKMLSVTFNISCNGNDWNTGDNTWWLNRTNWRIGNSNPSSVILAKSFALHLFIQLMNIYCVCCVPGIVLGTGGTRLKDLFVRSSLTCREMTRKLTVAMQCEKCCDRLWQISAGPHGRWS